MKVGRNMKSIADIINEKNFSKAKHNKYEFQAYGNILADELGDNEHRSLYIKYAKTLDRAILEAAREFIKGTNTLKSGSKARLFMWKLKELRGKKV